MPLVLRGIGLESGILVQKFAVRQGSAGRCKHRPLQMICGICLIGKVSSRRGEGIPPYGLFYYLLRTIKCSVGNGLDRSEPLFYMP